MPKFVAILAAAVTLVGLAVAAAFVFMAPSKPCATSSVAGGTAAIGGPFTLVDHTGKTVTEKDIIKGPTLVYFGYTYCPDVCPLDIARNVLATDILAERGIDVTPVFISIDPERDTVSAMADFVSVIHPKLIGLTGTLEQVDAASKAYKTYYRKNGEGEDYLMDHSVFTYLMGPDGLWDFFRREVSAEQIADTVQCFANQS